MRVKTEEKRAAIIEAAKAVFLEHGYDAASMAEVSVRAGGSKQTLYSYFASKADLFVAVMLEKGAAQAPGMFDQVHSNQDLRSGLLTFGRAFLTFLMQDDVLAVRRMIMAEGSKSDLGVLFHENGPKRGWTRMADEFAERMDRGEMRRADPWRAAMHLQGLLEAGPFQRCLEGAQETVSDAKLRLTVEEAVDVFLRAYRPDA
jgi:AcrR family transcriptional regulator